MICLTRFNGSPIYINPELILSLESTPDCVVTMTTGEKFVLKESVDEVIALFMTYQYQIHGPRETLSAS